MKLTVSLLLTLSLSCKSQSQLTSSKSTKEFEFTGLTFLSSKCNGTCPDISMNLYEDKRIEISRAIFSKKGQVDTALSGNFKGNLNEKEFRKVVSLLRTVDLDTLASPTVLCCDAPIVTLMFSYNGIYNGLSQ